MDFTTRKSTTKGNSDEAKLQRAEANMAAWEANIGNLQVASVVITLVDEETGEQYTSQAPLASVVNFRRLAPAQGGSEGFYINAPMVVSTPKGDMRLNLIGNAFLSGSKLIKSTQASNDARKASLAAERDAD